MALSFSSRCILTRLIEPSSSFFAFNWSLHKFLSVVVICLSDSSSVVIFSLPCFSFCTRSTSPTTLWTSSFVTPISWVLVFAELSSISVCRSARSNAASFSITSLFESCSSCCISIKVSLNIFSSSSPLQRDALASINSVSLCAIVPFAFSKSSLISFNFSLNFSTFLSPSVTRRRSWMISRSLSFTCFIAPLLASSSDFLKSLLRFSLVSSCRCSSSILPSFSLSFLSQLSKSNSFSCRHLFSSKNLFSISCAFSFFRSLLLTSNWLLSKLNKVLSVKALITFICCTNRSSTDCIILFTWSSLFSTSRFNISLICSISFCIRLFNSLLSSFSSRTSFSKDCFKYFISLSLYANRFFTFL